MSTATLPKDAIKSQEKTFIRFSRSSAPGRFDFTLDAVSYRNHAIQAALQSALWGKAAPSLASASVTAEEQEFRVEVYEGGRVTSTFYYPVSRLEEIRELVASASRIPLADYIAARAKGDSQEVPATLDPNRLVTKIEFGSPKYVKHFTETCVRPEVVEFLRDVQMKSVDSGPKFRFTVYVWDGIIGREEGDPLKENFLIFRFPLTDFDWINAQILKIIGKSPTPEPDSANYPKVTVKLEGAAEAANKQIVSILESPVWLGTRKPATTTDKAASGFSKDEVESLEKEGFTADFKGYVEPADTSGLETFVRARTMGTTATVVLPYAAFAEIEEYTRTLVESSPPAPDGTLKDSLHVQYRIRAARGGDDNTPTSEYLKRRDVLFSCEGDDCEADKFIEKVIEIRERIDRERFQAWIKDSLATLKATPSFKPMVARVSGNLPDGLPQPSCHCPLCEEARIRGFTENHQTPNGKNPVKVYGRLGAPLPGVLGTWPGTATWSPPAVLGLGLGWQPGYSLGAALSPQGFQGYTARVRPETVNPNPELFTGDYFDALGLVIELLNGERKGSEAKAEEVSGGKGDKAPTEEVCGCQPGSKSRYCSCGKVQD